jgi:hypothetical protein
MRPLGSVQQTTNAGTPEPLTENPQTNPFYFRNTGKPRIAHKTPAKITTRRKISEWSGFGKTCCAATESAEPPEIRLPAIVTLLTFSGAGEGI